MSAMEAMESIAASVAGLLASVGGYALFLAWRDSRRYGGSVWRYFRYLIKP